MLVLSQYVEEGYAIDLLAEGGDGVGYLLKDRVGDVKLFTDAVVRVAQAGPRSTPRWWRTCSGASARRTPLDELTPREREVLGLMAEGARTARSPRTWS